jgi:hypothetical protein
VVAGDEGRQIIGQITPAFGEKNPKDAPVRFIRPPFYVTTFSQAIEDPRDAVPVLVEPLSQLALIYPLDVAEPDQDAALLRRQIISGCQESLAKKIDLLRMGAVYPEAG